MKTLQPPARSSELIGSSQAFKTTGDVPEQPVILLLNLSGQDTEEDEDEHPLEGVGDGEEVGGEGGLVKDVEHAERPGGSENEQQGESPASTGPDVFIVAYIRLFHRSVSEHFVDNYYESQEIH